MATAKAAANTSRIIPRALPSLAIPALSGAGALPNKRELLMRHLACAVGLVGASLALSGCMTALGRTAVGPLKPVEVGMQQTVTCADLVKAIRSASDKVEQSQAIGGVAPGDSTEALRLKNTELLKTIAQTDAAYETCERKEASQRVLIDLEAARRLG